MATGLLSREIDLGRVVAWLERHAVASLVVLGMCLRLQTYLADRGFWQDENSLAGCIRGFSPWTAPAPLESSQLVPFGFLVLERGVAAVLGTSRLALRLVPLLAGLVALPLFVRLARRHLDSRAVPVAVGLFALSDPLTYFATELKPYSVDVAAALAAWVMPGDWWVNGRRAGAAAAVGAGLVWLSFPVVFVLAAVGVDEALAALRARNVRRAVGTAGIGMAWLASFAAAHTAARRLLAQPEGMQAFWNFAFPPPGSMGALAGWLAARTLNVFANPLHFDLPLVSAGASAVAGAGLATAGLVVTWRADARIALRWGLPIGLAWIAASLRLYPIHGRLLLFLTPVLLAWIAAGVAAVAGAVRSRPLRLGVIGLVLSCPAWEAIEGIVEPELRFYSPFGDRRPNPFLSEEPRP